MTHRGRSSGQVHAGAAGRRRLRRARRWPTAGRRWRPRRGGAVVPSVVWGVGESGRGWAGRWVTRGGAAPGRHAPLPRARHGCGAARRRRRALGPLQSPWSQGPPPAAGQGRPEAEAPPALVHAWRRGIRRHPLTEGPAGQYTAPNANQRRPQSLMRPTRGAAEAHRGAPGLGTSAPAPGASSRGRPCAVRAGTGRVAQPIGRLPAPRRCTRHGGRGARTAGAVGAAGVRRDWRGACPGLGGWGAVPAHPTHQPPT